MGVQLHPTQQIVNVNLGGDQQGLVAEFTTFRSGLATDTTPPNATAVDTGHGFSGVNCGASGSGYTVLTAGLVCYGKPRDGKACFIAAPDFIIRANYFSMGNLPQSNTIKRGVVTTDDEGNPQLEWSAIQSVDGLQALTFAGGAFHITTAVDNSPSYIHSSYDGVTFQQNLAWPAYPDGNPDTSLGTAGAVAYIKEPDNPDDPGRFTCVGTAFLRIEDVSGPLNSFNLGWSTSPAPPKPAEDEVPSTVLSWAFGYVSGFAGNPGSMPDGFYPLGPVCSCAGGKGIFVAATTNQVQFTVGTSEGGYTAPTPATTAAVSTSTDGASWSQQSLPGVSVGVNNDSPWSATQSVIFVRSGQDKGHFLCTAKDADNDKLFKSLDGKSWTQIKTGVHLLTLSTIAKDPSTTTIVHV